MTTWSELKQLMSDNNVTDEMYMLIPENSKYIMEKHMNGVETVQIMDLLDTDPETMEIASDIDDIPDYTPNAVKIY